MAKWTPPPALVKKVQERANKDAYSNAEYIDKESVTKVLTASGMGDLVGLLQKLRDLDKIPVGLVGEFDALLRKIVVGK